MSTERPVENRRRSIVSFFLRCFGRSPSRPPSSTETVSSAFKWNAPPGLSLIGRTQAESDIFACGREKWKLSVHLFQIRQLGKLESYVALCIDWRPSDAFATECVSSFKLYVRTALGMPIQHRARHRFTSFPSSGYTFFIPMEQVLDPETARRSTSQFSVVFRLLDDARRSSKSTRMNFATHRFSGLSIFAMTVGYLYHLSYVRQALRESEILDRGSEDGELLAALRKVFEDMERRISKSVDLMTLFKAYGSDFKDLGRCFEFWEFFQYFTWRLGGCWKKREDSPFHTAFVGTTLHSFQNISAVHLREFEVLELEILSPGGFHEALNHVCTSTSLSTGHSLQHRTQFSSLPPVLRLILKRFKYDALQRKDLKLLHFFDFPTHLSLDHSAILPGSPNSTSDLSYELTAIIAHEGNSLKMGYYVLYLRENDKQWRKYAASVSVMTQSQVMESTARSACYLSYTRIREWPHMMRPSE